MSIMISNEWVLPWLLRSGQNVRTRRLDALILNMRRSVIGLVILGAYGFHLLATDTRSLAGLGLLAFVAVAQLAPAFLLGLLWRATSARGAIAGISVGFLIWGIWLALPTMAPSVVRAAPNGSADRDVHLLAAAHVRPHNLVLLPKGTRRRIGLGAARS